MKKLFTITLLFFSLVSLCQEDTKNELSLIFIGDFMGHKAQIDAAYDATTKTYDYYNSFMYMKHSLSDADFTLGNLEVTLGVKPYSGYPQFSSPASFASAIKDAGVDVLVTSNNHSCDKKKVGLEKTIRILDSLNIKHTGTFISPEEKEKQTPFILEKNGFKIAILNFTYGTNGIPPTAPNVVNYIKEETIKADIKKAKEAKVDKIIALMHWGKEYKDLPDSYQKKWFNFLKANGVTTVVGAHPHVVQPMKHNLIDDSFIAYSLGNFVSHQRTFPRDGGAILKLTLTKKDEKVAIKNAQYKLTWVYTPIENGKKQYYVLPVSDYEYFPEFFTKKKDYDKMMRFTNHVRKLLKKENLNVTEYK